MFFDGAYNIAHFMIFSNFPLKIITLLPFSARKKLRTGNLPDTEEKNVKPSNGVFFRGNFKSLQKCLKTLVAI